MNDDEKSPDASDMVNSPAHYQLGGIEVIDAIEAWQLDFHLGNAVKYIARAAHKGRELEDLKKARWYLDRAITNREKSDPSLISNVFRKRCPTCGAAPGEPCDTGGEDFREWHSERWNGGKT